MTSLTAEERVVTLLRTFDEARVSYGVGSTGQGVTLLPSMWHEGSYAELEARLIELRESSRRPLWWHASQRHRWGVERTIVAPVRRRVPTVVFSLPPYCEVVYGGPSIGSKAAVVRVYRWSPDVDEGKAAEGIRALVRLMHGGRRFQITLPKIVLRRKLGLDLEPEDPAESGRDLAVRGRGRERAGFGDADMPLD